VGRAPGMPREDPYELAVASDEYFCPVCGIGLAQSDFEKPEKDYYCPYCTTGQKPSSVHPRNAGEVGYPSMKEEPSPALSGLSHRELRRTVRLRT
jgi:hypothetical protein